MIRSYLFVPAHEARFVARAHERQADAVLLDLEDSVPAEQKHSAREALATGVRSLHERGATVFVRVNGALGDCARDLEAACRNGVSAIVLPKVIGPDQVRWVDEYIGACEAGAHMPIGGIGLVALIETPEALLSSFEIAKASPRLRAIALGGEDLSTHCRFAPTGATLTAPCQQLVLAARAANLEAVGLPGAIGEVADLDRFGDAVRLAVQLGLDGVFCIHPKQVDVVNTAFSLSPETLKHATRIVEAFEAAARDGRGAVLLDGEMIDAPIVERARATLRRNHCQKNSA